MCIANVCAILVTISLMTGCSANGTNYSQTLSVVFNPMYSGYDGTHTYQIPATIENASVNGISNVTWEASDSSYVDLVPQSDGVSVMITTKRAGTVTIIAHTSVAQGRVPLTIAAYTPAQWSAGQTRYTSGAQLTPGPGGVKNSGNYVACTSCHSDQSSAPAIEHTPQQTGGFTDAQMKSIFEEGQLPASDQNPLNINASMFASFHKWQVASDDEANGLNAYLRALTPKAQGTADFGGRGPGGPPPRDGGVSARSD
jgi:hypothetical protein